jgi:hypothetical protein
MWLVGLGHRWRLWLLRRSWLDSGWCRDRRLESGRLLSGLLFPRVEATQIELQLGETGFGSGQPVTQSPPAHDRDDRG